MKIMQSYKNWFPINVIKNITMNIIKISGCHVTLFTPPPS